MFIINRFVFSFRPCTWCTVLWRRSLFPPFCPPPSYLHPNARSLWAPYPAWHPWCQAAHLLLKTACDPHHHTAAWTHWTALGVCHLNTQSSPHRCTHTLKYILEPFPQTRPQVMFFTVVLKCFLLNVRKMQSRCDSITQRISVKREQLVLL